MTKVDVLLGLQWGDEGKGKIVDVLSRDYDVIARFQGGPNAGHTLEFDGQKFVLNTIPSGVFNDKTVNVIGNGVVIDPITLQREITKLAEAGHNLLDNGKLLVARKAHLILPTHQLLDAANEQKMGVSKIGSTLKGIGPTYMDKTGRNGLRVGDIESPGFKEKYNKLVAKHKEMLSHFDFEYELEDKERQFFEAIEFIKQLPIIDSEHYINKCLAEDKKILAEGAQGTLLDVDFGSYPFVTSSNTTTAGACTGLGIAPNRIGEVIGIFKAYCTRVGSGPFPTELDNETGELLRSKGFEFGAVSGRKRRCGWLDLPALKYAIMLNGVTELVITKADVLTGFNEVMVCTHYKHNGKTIDYMPFDIIDNTAEPVLKSMAGWQEDICDIRDYNSVPKNLQDYLTYLEAELGVKIKYLSVGPDREETITL